MSLLSSSSPPRVFVVEDDCAVREGLRMALTENGYQVEAYASGDAFLDLAAPGPRDVVLLDLSLPGRSGVEIGETLTRRGLGTPIVVLSGLPANAFRRGVEAVRPRHAFRKPLRTEELLAVLAPLTA